MKTSYPNSTGWCLAVLALISISSTANAQTIGEFTPSTSTAIWNAYVANPNADDHIPNNSFAGYRQGVVPLPQIPQVVDVTNYGAVGDGVTDNSEAFRQAISAAYGMGGGAVYVPAGTYATEDPIWLRYDNVVLRGAGKGVTNIKFTRSLVDSVGNVNPNSTNIWSWSGGQIWVGPNDKAVFSDDADDAELRVDTRDSKQGYSSSSNPWEYWRLTNEVTTVTDVNARGDKTITVGNAASFKPGELILMTWDNTSNYDLFKELGQDPSWLGFTEWGDWFQPFKYPRWIWPVQIESISGNTITLKQPLRASTAAVYNVALWKNEKNAYVTEVGIEDLTIVMDGDADGQTYDLGWNGLYLVRAFNCWVRDVEVLNGNNGFHVSASKNLTLRGTEVTGDRWVHHPYTARCMAADILFEDFTIDVTEDSTGGTHGLNAEFLASGNVWSKGTMNRGTFDTHRGMPFDMLRSEITLRNEDNSNPGGATKAGPYALSRMVHWNIDIVNNDRPDVDGQPQAGLYVAQPEVHSFGAIVGVKGAPLSLLGAWESTQGNVMPIGNKDVLVADLGSTPGITNLYDAQMNLRRTTEKAVYLTRPTYPFIRHGAPITLEADGYAGTSNITSVTFYVDGVAVHTDSSAPFTHSWNPDMGEYDLNLSMLDSTGTTTWATQEETVTVGVVNDWDNTSGSLNFVGAGWDQNLSASYWLGGSVAETRSNGDYVEFSFTGTRFKFYTSGGISQSVRYDLEINGSLVVDSLDIRRDAGVGYVAYDTGWMPEGDYTIRISNRDRLYIDRVVSYATSLSAPTNSIPSATLTSDVAVGEGPLTVAFDASGSSDPDPSDTLAFSWDFGDGNTAGNVTAVNHTYANPGSYTATVSVTDGSATATDSISIIVTQQGTTNSIPSARLTSDVTVGEGPLTVAFDASGSSDPDPSDTLAFSWDFGDGNTAGNVTGVNHTYANPGSYTATVSVTDGSATATDSIGAAGSVVGGAT